MGCDDRPSASKHTETKDEKSYKSIKDFKYALLKNTENLTDNQKANFEMIILNGPKITIAYHLK